MSYLSKMLEQPFNLLDAQAFNANQRGEITANQQRQLKTGISWGRIMGFITMMAIMGSVFVLVFIPIMLKENGRGADAFFTPFFSLFFIIAFSLTGYELVTQGIKMLKLREDINNPAIRQGQGQLIHSNKGYSFDMDGNTLRLSANLANGLLPGTIYQIYYLERSKLLLSATSAYQANPAQAQDAINEILSASNGFSSNDVLSNQNGQATFAQFKKLIPNIIFGIGIIFGSMLFTIPFILTAASPSNKMSGWGVLFVFGIIGIIIIAAVITSIKSLLDLLSPNVQKVQGQGRKDQRIIGSGRNRRTEYSYIINGQRFVVNNYKAYTALIDGLQYRVYYFSRTKKLISIEVVNVGKE